ncbi:MAG TPA: SRPBCC domain-containing protein [Vicinamibacteria bacterium]|jgi:uncharacterized protein YndB with AHSA1/START domain
MSPRIEIALEVAAPPSRVFEALTRASELERWFTEKAFVSETERRFDFWGRHTPGNPDREAGSHRLRAFEPEKRLAFEWNVRETDTTVEIALERSARGTSLRLTHDAPRRGATEISLSDFWLLSFENLRRFVEGGAPPVLCDYAAAPRGGVDLAVDIEAPPEAVFRALIKPEDLDRWMNARSTVEPVVGGRMSFGWPSDGPVRIVSIVPNEKLSYSWAHENDPETIVTWTLEAPNGRRTATRLVLLHSGFGERDTEDFRTGWLKHLSWMKAMLERGGSWIPPAIRSAGYDA